MKVMWTETRPLSWWKLLIGTQCDTRYTVWERMQPCDYAKFQREQAQMLDYTWHCWFLPRIPNRRLAWAWILYWDGGDCLVQNVGMIQFIGWWIDSLKCRTLSTRLIPIYKSESYGFLHTLKDDFALYFIFCSNYIHYPTTVKAKKWTVSPALITTST